MSAKRGLQLRLAGSACDTCVAREGLCVPPQPALAVPGRVRLAVVNETPSRADVELGAPLSGHAGRFLRRGLRTLGIAPEEVHWTSAVLCSVRGKDEAKARKSCAVRLREELKAAHVTHVVTLGALGLQSAANLAKKPQNQKWRGSVVTRQHVETLPAGLEAVFPLQHPAFVMRSMAWGPVLEGDVERIGRVLRAGFVAPEDAPHRRFIVPRTLEELRAALALLIPGADVSFDVETVGLGPTRTSLVCFGISDGVTTIVVPWSRASNGLEPFWGFPGDVLREINACFATRLVVTHNGPAFDHIVAARYGIEIPHWGDTLLAAHATAGHLPRNLAQVVTANAQLDVPPWKLLEDRGVDIERLWFYNGRDCLYTILAWHKLKGEVT